MSFFWYKLIIEIALHTNVCNTEHTDVQCEYNNKQYLTECTTQFMCHFASQIN